MIFLKQTKIINFIFIALILCLVTNQQGTAEEKISDAERLFDLMEKQTAKIKSIRVDVLLENVLHKKKCSLSIMSPDKFAIEFDDSSIEVFFNGSKLWLKIAEIKEVFYHFAAPDNSWWSYVSFFNPRNIFTNLTRKTLFTLFKIKLIKTFKSEDEKKTYYILKFTPKMKTVFREVFEVGYYNLRFSDSNYLPDQVIEFDSEGDERGRLNVIQYKINIPIPAKRFEFTPPPDYSLVPLSVVFAQKLEECGNLIIKKFQNSASSMKDAVLNWGF
ncbi:MAG: LolA family protein [Candidatus Rifleibacteriota bacterium]